MNHTPRRPYLRLQPGVKGLLPLLLIALLWCFAFPLEESLNYYNIALEAVLLATAAVAFEFVLSLRINALSWGWSLFLYSFWLDLLEEFTREPTLWSKTIIALVEALGLALIGLGFYHIHRLFKHQQKKTQITAKRAHHLAQHDPLTGLANQTLLQDRLEQAMAEALHHRKQLALLFLDLDRFKELNDSLGHEIGNDELIWVAQVLRCCLAATDTAFRAGGDEFAIIQTPVLDLDEAAFLAQRILETLSEAHTIQGHKIYSSASIGITLFPNDAHSATQLLKNADRAMYHAKHKGRNNYQLYTPTMNARAHSRMALAKDLRHAFESGHLYLQFQPQLDLAADTTVSFEALLRWHYPQQGMPARQAFIRLAEETGLIIPIGAWVLETACRACFSWQQQHSGPVHVAVNLSPRQFRQSDLAGSIATILATTGLPPTYLEVEITEGLLLEDMDAAAATLRAISALGVHIAVDDFGTGHSSLTYLKRLPFDSIKIDRSFVRDIPGNAESQAITKAIIALGHSLDLKVIAEGVETRDQLLYLRELSCDIAQGYFISEPLDGPKAQQWWVEKGEREISSATRKVIPC